MKTVVLIQLFLILALSSEAIEMGAELPLAKKRNGAPDFDVLFEYEAEVSWVFRYRTSLEYDQLTPYNQTIYWKLYDQTRRRSLFPWRTMERWRLSYGELTLRRRKILANLLPHQNRIVILFAQHKDDRMQPIFHVDLRSLCANHVDRFSDVTRGLETCKVSLPNKWTRECTGIHNHFRARVRNGLNSCEEAKESVWRFGCGEFKCPAVKTEASR